MCSAAPRNKYVGEFYRNARHGHGISSWPSGDRFEGLYERDRRQGMGSYYYANGEIDHGMIPQGGGSVASALPKGRYMASQETGVGLLITRSAPFLTLGCYTTGYWSGLALLRLAPAEKDAKPGTLTRAARRYFDLVRKGEAAGALELIQNGSVHIGES